MAKKNVNNQYLADIQNIINNLNDKDIKDIKSKINSAAKNLKLEPQEVVLSDIFNAG